MLNKNDFFSKYNITQNALDEILIDWETLISIYQDNEARRSTLEHNGNNLAEIIRKEARIVHSVKSRVKNSEHVIEKIIRKKMKDISLENYKDEITDIIGIRVLHLFKEDWLDINEFIVKKWNLLEKPVLYYREGDELNENLIKSKGIEPKIHPKGYRSLHYLIETASTKEKLIAEVQVRTLFEEAWSEIDHIVRYPHNQQHTLLSPYLNLFNRLAGNADEIGSYVNQLQNGLKQMDQENLEKERSFKDIIKNLEVQVQKLQSNNKVTENEKTELQKTIKKLKQEHKVNQNAISGILDEQSNSLLFAAQSAYFNSLKSFVIPKIEMPKFEPIMFELPQVEMPKFEPIKIEVPTFTNTNSSNIEVEKKNKD